MGYTTRTTCRCCGSAGLTDLFSLGEQHVSGFPKPGEDAGPKVPITLQLCRECTLVQAKHSPAADMYSGHYWYTSGRNQTMRDALADVARAVQKRAQLKPGDVVLDIGSNDGTLLRAYSKELVRIGCEPADNLATQENYPTGAPCWMLLMHDFWSYPGYCKFMYDKHERAGLTGVAPPRVKAITALGMMYDMEEPGQFVADVAKVLAPDGVFCAQLMCLKQTVAMRDVGNLAHEHLEFYSLRSLMTLLNKHGLTLEDVEENSVNGGSYRLWIGGRDSPRKVESARIRACLNAEATLDRLDTYSALFERMQDAKAKVASFLRGAASDGRNVWGCGASTKGNVMLQWWGADPLLIQAIADRSPEKWGRVTCNGIPIVSEEQFRQDMPDYAVILPYSFLPEFLQREREWLDDGGRFLVPLPEPYLLGADGRKEML